jgi:sigma-B regulation protein RsbU (phosphoserine phosphatase)
VPQQILLITRDKKLGHTLRDNLCAAGYTTVLSDVLQKPSEYEHRPALCVVDLCFQDNNPTTWHDWLQDCHDSHTACIGFNSQGAPDHDLVAGLDPLSDTLTETDNPELLKSKVRSLLTIRKLTRQLSATRHQLAHYQESLQDALESAAHIQRSLIPTSQPSYGKLHYSCRFMPCKQVGGDLFNIVQLDEQTVMTYVVDVSGHGVSSAMVTVSVHQSLSRHTGQLVKRPTEYPPYYAITSPRDVLKELETEYPFERFEEFFTISYLLINPDTGEVRYSNGGHPPPLLLRKDGQVERLSAGGTVIGVGKLVDFEEGQTRLAHGDRLFIYTDGITEHTSSQEETYGEERFVDELLKTRDRTLDDATRDTLIALREFGGSTLPVDDVTLIGVEFSEP